ncbi:amino acid permease [Grosmannia clavigera kw1407]|uniref:Amino acid permease n=1 Tax=Grosmannia clavigera (strain kw1407 / UAMH 11150) TaxID=655863 RepID=F0XB20_GROCL|nr:amino acid permease [Grosmannia clavigera kw1407]EFX05078.1 amino acid permease [Grosmannia clavigera kw1407]
MSKGFESEAFAMAGEPVSNSRATSDFYDKNELARLGKKQVLRRTFGFMSILGFSCTILITWEAVTVLFSQGLNNGGTAGVIYSFIVVWVGNFSVFSTMCELVSMAPTSGGQYHWVAMMAPRSCAKFLSYMTGMLTVGGWQASVASSALLTGDMILALASLNNVTFEPALWQGTLLFWAVFLFAVFINVLVSSTLPKFEGLILILHVVGFFAILIPLVVLGPHDSAHSVFTTFVNNGEFATTGLSFLVGMMGNAFAFVGTDAAFHMSEETVNPGVVVPRSILLSLVINGSAGFAMLIAMVFCMGNFDDAVSSGPGLLGYPFMYIFQQATGSTAGASVMSAIILILATCATVGMLASTSRVFWSFSRDRGMPYWRVLSRVDQRTSVPVWAVGITTVIAVLLSLINIGSYIAFQNITSVSISCLYSSYLIAAVLLLYRRTTTGFVMPDSTDMPALANTTGAKLVWGPFRVPGVFGVANNVFAICYLIVVGFFSFWPPMMNPTPQTMNYSVVVTGGLVLFSLVYYFVWARKEFNGPIVEAEIALNSARRTQ